MSIPPAPFPPGYTCTQGQNIPGFKSPPLDHTLHVNEFIDWHLLHSPNHPFAILTPDGDQGGKIREYITYAELGQAVHELGRQFLLEAISTFGEPVTEDGKPVVVSVIAQTDTLIYSTILWALWRAGFVPFPLSTRNSVPALHHLVTSTNSHYIVGSLPSVTGQPTAVQQTTQKLLESLKEAKYDIHLIHTPTYDKLYPRLSTDPITPFVPDPASTFERIPPLLSLSSFKSAPSLLSDAPNREKDWPCVIIHSSGSTRFPKPIHLTQRLMISWSSWNWHGEVDIGGQVMGSGLALPPFHAIGVSCQTVMPLTTGAICAMWLPGRGPGFPTALSLLNGMLWTDCKFIQVVPDHIEAWSRDIEQIDKLKALTVVGWGGGVLSKEVGDKISARGVSLQPIYGMTEGGIIFSAFLKENLGADWQYGSFSSNMKYRLVPEGSGIFRVVLEETEHYIPGVFNVEGERAYNTNDLVEEHPTRKGMYKVVGRADDQIIMATGEKTHPVPIEGTIIANPLVRSVIMFGRGIQGSGVIIEPAVPVPDTPEDRARFIDGVWPSIEQANQSSPTHSRIFKELVIIADLEKKPFPRTAKATPQRGATIKVYDEEINKAYEQLSTKVDANKLQLPTTWDEDGFFTFVKGVVERVMSEGRENEPIDHNSDLFLQGCDSLQATFIKNTIRVGLKSDASPFVPQQVDELVTNNIVFDHPTTKSLAAYLYSNSVKKDAETAENSSLASHIREMRELVEKYTANIVHHRGLSVFRGKKATANVLITGTTGILGSYLTEFLVKSPQVAQVWALNRPASGASIGDRQREAFEDRGIDTSILASEKLQLLEGDVNQDQFDLPDGIWEELRASVDLVIHNAWRLDFNLRLPSYEQLVHGVRKLIDFSTSSPLATPPRLFFTSSVSTVIGFKGDSPVPEIVLDDPEIAVGTGYGESKWVSDQILAVASQAGVPTSTARIGQLAGSTTNGAWNVTDWFPHIVRAAYTTKTLPVLDNDLPVAWLPVDIAARAVGELALNPSEDMHSIYHIIHPNPTTWNTIIQEVADVIKKEGLIVDQIPFRDWVDRLQALLKYPESIRQTPAVKLLDFYQSGLKVMETQADSREAMGLPLLGVDKTAARSDALRSARPLGKDDIGRWLAYWRHQSALG